MVLSIKLTDCADIWFMLNCVRETQSLLFTKAHNDPQKHITLELIRGAGNAEPEHGR